MVDPYGEEVLNPAQQRVIDELRSPGVERPEFEPDLAFRLREQLEMKLTPLTRQLDRPLRVSKQALQRVLGCELHHVTEEEVGFSWSLPSVRGTVVHKAIQLSVTWRSEPNALDLVVAAIDRLIDDPNGGDLAAFLDSCSPGEVAELTSEASDLVCKFLEQWPRLLPSWKPRSESRMKCELLDGRVILNGKADLTLGVAEGNKAGRLIVDFKTGHSRAQYGEDLRFYALIDTLCMGIPPFRLACYYLDEASSHRQDVTEEVLEASLRRTVAGVLRLTELTLGLRSPELTPNPSCNWCSLHTSCSGAEEWRLSRVDQHEDVWS